MMSPLSLGLARCGPILNRGGYVAHVLSLRQPNASMQVRQGLWQVFSCVDTRNRTRLGWSPLNADSQTMKTWQNPDLLSFSRLWPDFASGRSTPRELLEHCVERIAERDRI